MGVMITLGTTRNMIKSLYKYVDLWLRTLPPRSMVYDNFDMGFNVAQPVTGHQRTHVSVTAATFAPYIGASLWDLQFTKETIRIFVLPICRYINQPF